MTTELESAVLEYTRAQVVGIVAPASRASPLSGCLSRCITCSTSRNNRLVQVPLPRPCESVHRGRQVVYVYKWMLSVSHEAELRPFV